MFRKEILLFCDLSLKRPIHFYKIMSSKQNFFFYPFSSLLGIAMSALPTIYQGQLYHSELRKPGSQEIK